MYSLWKEIVLGLLKCPRGQPDAPVGSPDSLVVFRAARAFLAYRFLYTGVSLFFFILFGYGIAGVNFLKNGPLAEILLFVAIGVSLALILGVYFVVRLEYEMRYYIVTDRSLRIREGVFSINEITLTFANIQNMKIQQGPIQRLFGIHDLIVESAAGAGAAVEGGGTNKGFARTFNQAVFRGIGRPEELRDLIMRHLRQVQTSGLGDWDDRAASGAGAATRPLLGVEELQVLRAIREETEALRHSFGDIV